MAPYEFSGNHRAGGEKFRFMQKRIFLPGETRGGHRVLKGSLVGRCDMAAMFEKFFVLSLEIEMRTQQGYQSRQRFQLYQGKITKDRKFCEMELQLANSRKGEFLSDLCSAEDTMWSSNGDSIAGISDMAAMFERFLDLSIERDMCAQQRL